MRREPNREPETEYRFDATSDDRPNWIQYYSGYAQYGKSDLFDIELLTNIEEKLSKTTVSNAISIGLPIIFIPAFLASLYCVVTGLEAPVFDGSDQSAIDFLKFITAEWFGLSKTWTGNSYVTTAIATLFISFLSQLELSWDLWEEAKEYTKQISELRRNTEGARQIYPGSGQIRFSFGRQGLRVAGNNLSLSIHWDAIWFTALFNRSEESRSGSKIVRYRILDAKENIRRATHLIVFLQPAGERRVFPASARQEGADDNEIKANEYLVIPQEFFSSYRDASSWAEFVGQIEAFKHQYEDAKTPTRGNSGDT